MIDDFLTPRLFEEPPDEMDFQVTLGALLGELEKNILHEKNYFQIYLKAPFVVSAVVDLQAEGNPAIKAPTLPLALEFLRKSYSGDDFEIRELINYFKEILPMDFQIESRADKYSWMGSNPKNVSMVAKKIKEYDPELIVYTAHGAIRSGELLAMKLDSESHPIRISRFKRNDQEAVITENDRVNLMRIGKNLRVVLYDEDACSGETLLSGITALKKLGFEEIRTAASVAYRHLGLQDHLRNSKAILNCEEPYAFREPDFVGHYFD